MLSGSLLQNVPEWGKLLEGSNWKGTRHKIRRYLIVFVFFFKTREITACFHTIGKNLVEMAKFLMCFWNDALKE